MTASELAQWAIFYQTTGSSAAALTGLMFIVVTLAANRRRAPGDAAGVSDGFSAFSTPSMVHLSAAFFISAGLTAPWHTIAHPAVLLALGGCVGVGYMIRIHLRFGKLTAYTPEPEDWVWYSLLPLVAYAVLIVAAPALIWLPAAGAVALAGDTLLLILIGIHNAWDIVTYIGMNSADR